MAGLDVNPDHAEVSTRWNTGFSAYASGGRKYDLSARCAVAVPHPLPSYICSFAISIPTFTTFIEPARCSALPPDLKQSAATRQISFLAGRLCATEALRQLGLSNCNVSRGNRGEPLWPRGIAGAITHSTDFACAAAVDRCASGVYGLGIDSERVIGSAALSDIAAVCLAEEERSDILNADDATLRATISFSLKESFYKAIFPIVRRFVEFTELTVSDIDFNRGCASLHPALLDWPPGRSPIGRFAVQDNHVHTSVLVL